MDGLKTITFNMGSQGTIGDEKTLTSAKVVYRDSLTIPAITEANGFNYSGPSGTGTLGWYDGSLFYKPGTTLTLAMGTVLTPGYSIAPSVTGPTEMSLSKGYSATSTGGYTITGTDSVTVSKTAGDARITWNSSTKKLDIAAGLEVGSYPVTLTASNGISPDTTLNFTLKVVLTYKVEVDPNFKYFNTAKEGYGELPAQNFIIRNTGSGTITGLKASVPEGSAYEISEPLTSETIGPGDTATVKARPKTGLLKGPGLSIQFYETPLNITGDNGISASVNMSFGVSGTAPTITGPTEMSLTEGYSATATGGYTITGTAPVTVSKTSGDDKIIWDDTNKKLDIAAGLTAGSYPVVLTAQNSTLSNASLNFTLTVKPTYTAEITPNSNTFNTVTEGYGEQEAKNFIILSTGTGKITGLEASLTDGTKFEISGSLTSETILMGGTAAVKVRPKTGLSAGTYTDTLKITGDNGLLMTAGLSFNVNALVNAETPVITVNLSDKTTTLGTAVTLDAASTVGGGGTITYVWYKNTTRSTTGATALGVTTGTYSPDVSFAGTTYYYCVVTNTNNAVTGVKTAMIESSIAEVKVNVTPVTVTSVMVKTAPTKTTYTAGDLLDLSGLVATLNRSDSTMEDVAGADFATKGITTTPTNGTGLSISDTAVTITYTADNQSVSQNITVNPAAVTVTSVTVKTEPTKTTYTAGDLLDLTGLMVTLHKSDSTMEDVAGADFATKGITTTPANGTGLSVSDTAVTITYTADNQTVSQNIKVNPAAVTVTSVTVKTEPTMTTYTAGDLLDLTDLVVTLHKSDNTMEDVASADFGTKGITTMPTNGTGLSVSDTAVTITYTADNQTVSQNITVNPAAVTVTSVTIKNQPTKTTYTAGDLLDLTGLVVTLHKSDSTIEDVASADFATKGITTTPTNGTGLSVSDSAVNIIYTADNQSVSQNITVNPAAVTVTSVTIKNQPTKTTYTAGDLLDLTGLVVTLHKSDGTMEDVAGADFAIKGITTTPTNGTGLSVSDTAVTIAYTADNQSVSQNITVNAAPTITTNSLDNGVVGTAYSKILIATGDTPITWSIGGGDLPYGLTLDANTGRISGTPTTTGTFCFTVKAINNEGDDIKPLSIYISSASSGNDGGNTGGGSPTPNTEAHIITTSSAISFGSLTVGYTSPPAIQTMTVKNTGNQSVTLTQPTSEHYAIGALSNNLLNKDETVTFTIQPKRGLVAGSYNESLSIAGTNETSASVSLSFTVTEAPVTVAYRGHIQNIGDYPLDGSWVNSPDLIGTVGQSKRIEGFEIRLGAAAPAEMELRYNVHVENKGWLYDENDCADWPKDGAYAGTRGESLRIEAVKLVLTDKDGKPYPGYSVYYRGHVQNVGDLPTKSADWCTDGEKLGTVGSALRLEALMVKVVKNETDLTAYQALLE